MNVRKAKVVLVGPLPPPVHGVTVSTARLLNSELLESFELLHVDTSDHRDVSNIGAFDFENFTLAIKSYLRLIRTLQAQKPDLVYVPISQTFLGFFRDSVFLLVPKIFGARVVIHLRGGHFGVFYQESGLLTRVAITLVLRSVDRVVVLGELLRPIFRPWFAEEQIDVVPNGTDLCLQGMEAKLSTFNTARHFTYMSSLMRAKGLVEFVRAAIVTIEAHPDSVFHIAGEWWAQESGLQQEIEAIVADSEACGKFVFHGLVTGQEKERLLFETDVFVLPTYYPFEGHPNCVVEAMAAGCPVITTNHASLAETVVDRETGYIVEKKDSLALAVAIVEMIVDRQKFWEMRRASYERFQEKYTSSRSTGLLIQAFRRAIGDEGAQ